VPLEPAADEAAEPVAKAAPAVGVTDVVRRRPSDLADDCCCPAPRTA